MPVLLLVRHAIAESRSEAWPDDTLRPLTERGVVRMREIAARLRALGEMTQVVLTSPLTRAVETAAVLADVWAPSPDVIVVDELAPGHSPSEMAEALRRVSARTRVALVGHEPDLGEFAAWLIGAHRPVPFKKGGVARIDVATLDPPSDGALVWLATPKILRAQN
jgi:phosphohistidine phosphatase